MLLGAFLAAVAATSTPTEVAHCPAENDPIAVLDAPAVYWVPAPIVLADTFTREGIQEDLKRLRRYEALVAQGERLLSRMTPPACGGARTSDSAWFKFQAEGQAKTVDLRHAPGGFEGIVVYCPGKPLRALQAPVSDDALDDAARGCIRPESALVMVEFDAKGADFKDWVGGFKDEIYRNWVVPEPEGKATLTVEVSFDVDRTGHPGPPVVERPSGRAGLDAAARAAVERSLFPPLPADYKRKSLSLRLWFRYQARPEQASDNGP